MDPGKMLWLLYVGMTWAGRLPIDIAGTEAAEVEAVVLSEIWHLFEQLMSEVSEIFSSLANAVAVAVVSRP